jgi:hypothetical protein
VDSECRIFQTCLLAILSLLPFDDAGLAMGWSPIYGMLFYQKLNTLKRDGNCMYHLLQKWVTLRIAHRVYFLGFVQVSE